MATVRLLDNANADTTGSPVTGSGASKSITVFADNFGGGTVTLELSDDNGGHWVPVTQEGTAVTFVENTSAFLRKLAQGQKIRAKLSGSSGASNVTLVMAD